MDKVIYGITWCFSLLPFWLMYIFSDITYFLVYRVVGYRKKVVRENLENSFPGKSQAELRKIERDFYRHFCDVFFETIKTQTMSNRSMQKRCRYVNNQLLDDYCEKNQNVILYLGHCGNWEWLTFARSMSGSKHARDYQNYSVYHPLENKTFDSFFLKMRSKSGAELVSQNNLLRTLVDVQRNNKRGFFCFIADQGPMWSGIYFWMNFLNQETAPIVGPERIARKTKYPAYYIDVRPIKRGYYEAEFILLTEDASLLPEFELTKRYMNLLEQTIRKNPSQWLWSHKRWKRKRSDKPEHPSNRTIL